MSKKFFALALVLATALVTSMAVGQPVTPPGLRVVTHDTTMTGSGTVAAPLGADPTVVQSRVSGTCAAGSSIRVVASNGTVTCETDDDTTYTAGTSMSLVGNAFTLNMPTTSCGAGTFVSNTTATGTSTCTAETGDISSVGVTAPITGGGTAGAVTIGFSATPTSCTAGTGVSSINSSAVGTCTADITSVTAPLSSNSGAATIALCTGNQILKMNAGGTAWVCAADNDTTYTATSPVSLIGSAFGLLNRNMGDITTTTGTNPGDTWTINNAAVTLAKMANVASGTFLGRSSVGTGVPEAMTPSAATSLLIQASTSGTAQGVVPGSNGAGATAYLNGSLGWTVPAAGPENQIVVPSVSTTLNDWNPTPGISGTTFIFISATSGSAGITGIANGVAGRRVTIYNNGGADFNLFHNNAGSAVGNRLALGASAINLPANLGCAITLTYETSTNFWRQSGLTCASMYFASSVRVDGPTFINQSAAIGSFFSATTTDIEAGGSTSQLSLGTSGTGGVNIGNSGNLTKIQAPLYINPSYGYRFHDDFETCPTAVNTSLTADQITYSIQGTASPGFVVDNSPGGGGTWCKLVTGSTAVSGLESAKANAGFGAAANAGLNRFYGGSSTFTFESLVRTDATLCDGTTDVCKFWDGFFNTNTSSFTNAIGFEFDPTVSTGFWRIVTCNVANGCTRTTTSIAIAASTNYKLGVTCTAAGSCSFAINNTAAGTIANTTVPTGSGLGFSPGVMMFKTAGTNTRNMFVDYIDFYQVFTTPR